MAELSPARVHRIDPRLVHATLLEAWVPYVDAHHLIVADAAVAQDNRRRIIFEMSARDVGKTHFVSENEVSRLLSSLPPDEPTIVVYGTLGSFVRALEAGLSCEQVMVGHIPDGEGRRRVHPSVYVGAGELEWVEWIRSQGVEVVVRPLPSDQARGLRRGDDARPVLTEDLPSQISLAASDFLALVEPESMAPPVAEQPARPPIGKDEQTHQGMVSVVNERGLHLRAAHVLAQCAGQFQSSVEVGWEGRMVNAKSLLGITTLGAAQGTQLHLSVKGLDAEAAFAAVSALFADGFEEGPG